MDAGRFLDQLRVVDAERDDRRWKPARGGPATGFSWADDDVRPQPSGISFATIGGQSARVQTVSAEGDNVMPPLIAWGVGMLGGAALVRWAVKEAQRINRELEEARLAPMQQPMQAERRSDAARDPVTGAYRRA